MMTKLGNDFSSTSFINGLKLRCFACKRADFFPTKEKLEEFAKNHSEREEGHDKFEVHVEQNKNILEVQRKEPEKKVVLDLSYKKITTVDTDKCGMI